MKVYTYKQLENELLRFLRERGYNISELFAFENSAGYTLEIQVKSLSEMLDPLNLIVSNDSFEYQLDEERVLNSFMKSDVSYECSGEEIYLHFIEK